VIPILAMAALIATVVAGAWWSVRTASGRRTVGAVIGAPTRSLSRTPLRASLALGAAALATVATVMLARDEKMTLQPATSLFFAAEAVIAAAVAFAMIRRRLASVRVLATVISTIAILALASSPLSLARSACACATPAGPAYVPPSLLGMDGIAWATVALVGVPVLLLISMATPRS
jgi:hypothetical protein